MLKPSLQLRLGQSLAMTPQLQQAIRLLQLTALDLQQQIRDSLESNVMLEAEEEADYGLEIPLAEVRTSVIDAAEDAGGPGEPDDGRDGAITDATDAEGLAENFDWDEGPTAAESETPWSGPDDRDQDLSDPSGQTLRDHLLWQLEMTRLDERKAALGRAVIDAIDDDGYFRDTLEQVCEVVRPEFPEADTDEAEAMLLLVQAFDPAGVGARSPGECVSLQLAQLEPATPGLALARELALYHLELVASQQMTMLRRQTRATDAELEVAIALVRSCNPRPGSLVHETAPEYVIPDVYVHRAEGRWQVDLNPGALPRVRVNEQYAGYLTRAAEHAPLRTQLQEARWLLRSLEIRNETLLKVARTIVQRQTAFFDEGEEAMEPMVLRDVAEAVEMHESTISRVTTGKYMHTPRGVLEFRFFFSSHVSGADGGELSSTAVRAKIRKLIAAEEPGSPLSDARLAELLSANGAQVARRTVAKYREAMNIPTSSERKRHPR
jgi:RNA polymerase sigma-54 factor